MIFITPISLILSTLAGVLVGAIPQPQQRDGPICIGQTTITVVTVTVPAAADPTTPPDEVVTVTETVTDVRTIDSVLEQASDYGATETVVVFTTEWVTIIVQPPIATEISDLTTGPTESPSPEPVAPLPPVVQPDFGNATNPGPNGNSSLPSSNSSSGLPHVPVLPEPSSDAAIGPSSEFAQPVSSSGYENSLYFTNWSVTKFPSFQYVDI